MSHRSNSNLFLQAPLAQPAGFVYWRYKGIEAIDELLVFPSPDRRERTVLRLAPHHHYWYGVMVADPATGAGATDRMRFVNRNRLVLFPGAFRRLHRPYRILYEEIEPSALCGYAPPIVYPEYGYAFVLEQTHLSESVPFLERRRLDSSRVVRLPAGTIVRSFWPILRGRYWRRIDPGADI